MDNLPKGIRERGGYLYISFQHNNHRMFQSTKLKASAENVAEAVEIRRAKLQALMYGVEPEEFEEDFKTGTFATIAQDFLDTEDLKRSTRDSYKQLLQTYWMPALQTRQISAIQLPKLRQVTKNTTWSSRKVKKNAISALRKVFQFAVDEGFMDSNPAQKLTIKREQSDDRVPDPYTTEERDTLLSWLEANAAPTTYAYFLTGFMTGMRTGELLALTWADYSGKKIKVNKARVRGEITTTKTSRRRTVLVRARLATVLNALPSRFKQDVIFANQYGKPYQAGYHLNRKFREAHVATGIRHRDGPYPWRHTYASVGLTSGAEPAWLAEQLGHSLQMFYNVYSTWISDEERDQQELAKLQ